MATVTLRDDRQEARDVDIALRKLKKAMERCGTLKDVQAKQAYEKPTTKRKRKKAAAKARHRREKQRNQLPERQY